jgi:FkbM family methyltransferase
LDQRLLENFRALIFFGKMAMRLNTPGKLNRFGKKITPSISRLVANARATSFIELVSSYLHCVIGKGGGSNWHLGEEIAAARFILREDPIIMDIGANNGWWTIELRKILEGRGRWILVDPAAECCSRLRQIEGVEVIEAAVGERSGKVKFYTPGDGSGFASLHKRHDSHVRMGNLTLEEREVDMTTIDEILDERGIDRVDLAKMDLEGHELFALRGATKSLETRRIHSLTFEIGTANVDSRTFFRDYFDLLTGYGYRISRIYPGGKTVAVVEYYEDLEYFRGVTNYIASVEA